MFNLSMEQQLGTTSEEGVMARTHGRPSTYNNGKCRCTACTEAIAAYRAGRRAQGLDLAPTKNEPALAGATPKGTAA